MGFETTCNQAIADPLAAFESIPMGFETKLDKEYPSNLISFWKYPYGIWNCFDRDGRKCICLFESIPMGFETAVMDEVKEIFDNDLKVSLWDLKQMYQYFHFTPP